MIPAAIESIANELRAAAGHRDYEAAGNLVVRLCGAAADCIRALPATDQQGPEIGKFVNDLLQWTDAMLRSSRADTADELRRVPFLKGYMQMSNF